MPQVYNWQDARTGACSWPQIWKHFKCGNSGPLNSVIHNQGTSDVLKVAGCYLYKHHQKKSNQNCLKTRGKGHRCENHQWVEELSACGGPSYPHGMFSDGWETVIIQYLENTLIWPLIFFLCYRGTYWRRTLMRRKTSFCEFMRGYILYRRQARWNNKKSNTFHIHSTHNLPRRWEQ